MAGTIVADTLTHSTAGSIATNYVVNGSAKVWAKVDQSSTQSILDSFNVASITDLALSETNLTFSNSMNNANYSVSGSCEFDSANYRQHQFSDETTSTLTVHNSPDYALAFNDGIVGTSVHGDLA